ncbi:Flavin-containing monooxygenase [Thalictrum thalictroides]|uniref:Flavin-containing monooxygenase n=1 Tax=Thalictrum thalictroides TaxID=46969 RepID=A0A7J6WQ46_THATH|nr:Flavin-containing monooxygenase [Thalictrum thalictroides]
MGIGEEEVTVVIVGAGPSGLATSACLKNFCIPNIILEREDCCASLWKKKTYDRLKLHLAKEFCNLPLMPFPSDAPTYVPKDQFISYIDSYVSFFGIKPKYHRFVESASYDATSKKWKICAKNANTYKVEVYVADFLVVATGENSEGFIPKFPGQESFAGELIHSSKYKSGSMYTNKNVLVVGSGNSGMEIAYDLYNHGACTSIVVKSPFHVLTKWMVRLGMNLLNNFRISWVDSVVTTMANLRYGDLSKYGIPRPAQGPFLLKVTTGRSPVLDVGTVDAIVKGGIKVLPAISSINKNNVVVANGEAHQFDVIIFATGYRSTATYWLKDYDGLLNKEGMPKHKFPDHWKGSNGLYCAGLARTGLTGVNMDARAVADDIKTLLTGNKNQFTGVPELQHIMIEKELLLSYCSLGWVSGNPSPLTYHQ